jgi:hypothetical protein
MTPYKKPRNGILSQAQLAANKTLASARIIIEDYFGRLSNRFLVMVCSCAFEEHFYPAIFKICCALANYDILVGEGGSLRMQEGGQCGVMLTRIYTKGKKAFEDAREKMKRKQSKKAAVREAQERIDREAAIDPEEDEQRVFAAYSETSGEE